MNPTGTFPQRHPGLVLTAVGIVGIAIVLVLAELLTRLVLPEWAPTRGGRTMFYHYDERLGWAMLPGQEDLHEQRDFSVRVKVNSTGLRDEEVQPKGSRKRLLILGDSFGWGYGVELEDRFDSLLDERFPDWDIVNASVSGYGTDQEYLYLLDQGLALEPDAVLLLFYQNDFVNNTRSEQYWYNKPYYLLNNGDLELQNVPVPESSLNQKFKRFVRGRTYLYGRLHERISIRYEVATGRMKAFENDASLVGSERHPVTYALLKSIDEASRAANAKFVLVNVPMKLEEDLRFLETFAQQENVPHLALEDAFAAATTPMTFKFDSHWNPAGHKLAADRIESFLYENNIVESN